MPTIRRVILVSGDNRLPDPPPERHPSSCTPRLFSRHWDQSRNFGSIAVFPRASAEITRRVRTVAARCVRYSNALRSLSIIIPAYNEEKRLPSTLDRVLEFLATADFSPVEVLVVDDGSRDGTAAVVEKYSSLHPVIRLLGNPGNRGKGYAVRNGMLAATGEWRLFSDADLSSPITELAKLLTAAEGSGAVVVIGSRALDRSLVGVHQPLFRELSGRFFNLIMRLAVRLPFRDTQCGFKLYHAKSVLEIFPRQQLDGFSFDVEDLFIARKRKLKSIEVPVVWNNVEGTKVSLWHGLQSFGDLVKIRWNQVRGKYR